MSEEAGNVFEYTCPICGRRFSTEYHWKKYCSRLCATKAQHKYTFDERRKFEHPADPFNCAYCGKYYVPAPGEWKYRFCSLRCKLKYKEWRKSWGTGHRIIKAPSGVFGR